MQSFSERLKTVHEAILSGKKTEKIEPFLDYSKFSEKLTFRGPIKTIVPRSAREVLSDYKRTG